MADDPVTISDATTTTIREGLVKVSFLCAGPADYDSTNGAAMDLSTYVTTIEDGPFFGGVTAAADALVLPTYVNDDFDDADGGAAYFTWSGTAGAALDNVDNATDLSGYVWRCTVFGTPA